MVLAVALAIFVLLSGFTLLAFRQAAARASAERRAEVLALAERLAREAPGAGGRVDALVRIVPPGAALALFAADGRLLDAWGHVETPTLAPGLDLSTSTRTQSITGDGAELPRGGTLAALAPFVAPGGERRFLRLDLPVPALAAARRSLAWLTPTVLALSVAAAVVVLLYVRALARPYEALLARAREAGAEVDELDELAALVATFDRALEALAARGSGTPGGPATAPLGGLQEALGAEHGGGFLLLDREGTLLAATPAAAELLGVPAPPTGVPLARALDRRPELVRLLEPAIGSGEPLPRGAIRVERREGAATLGVTAEPLRGEGGRPRGWLVVVADLTELERHAAQERLADGLAQLGELSAGVAHELRNSLASLSGWLSLARREPLPAPATECLDEAGRETAALARVVEDFLAFARPGTRRGERVDLVALARRAARDPALGDVAVELALPERAEIEGDPGLLDRALRNLIANAARAERDAGRHGPLGLALAAAESPALGPVWEIAVEDRGPGIPPAVRQRLFEPFAAGPRGGAGLGLALARRIAVLHGGEVSLADRPEGGTRATLRLPRVADVTNRSGGPASGPPPEAPRPT
jgi:signal transduction histidine kinase